MAFVGVYEFFGGGGEAVHLGVGGSRVFGWACGVVRFGAWSVFLLGIQRVDHGLHGERQDRVP